MEFAVLIAVMALGGVALLMRVFNTSIITLPMVCLSVGIVLYFVDVVPPNSMGKALELVAEATLAIVLFVDASQLKIAAIRRNAEWPTRMLALGLPLAIGLGSLVFLPFFPGMPIWEIVLLAALLAPTDAALGEAVFSNPKVPERIREALTAESGLNDGLALPAIIFFACAAVGFDHDLDQGNWVLFAGSQIFVGVGVGALLGAAGGWASHESVHRGFAEAQSSAVFGLLLVAIVFFAAETLGGNPFVAVFVAGILFGKFAKDCAGRARQFLHTEGTILLMVAFVYIGAILVPKGLMAVDWRIFIAVLLSLFVVRPLAIWLSLRGTQSNWRTRLFLGWFGPRGLATALFTLIVLDEFSDKLMSETILATTMLAVVLSTVLHGVSAHFAARLCRGNFDE